MRRLVMASIAAFLLLVPAAEAKFPASVPTTVQPGGTSQLGSPPLTPDMKSATVDIVPDAGDALFFEDMTVVLAATTSPRDRLLTCIGIYIASNQFFQQAIDVDLDNPEPITVLMMAACLAQASAMNRAQQQPRATVAQAGCSKIATQVGATFTRVRGSRYRASLEGTVKRTRKRGKVKVTCSKRGRGMRLKVRPTNRRKSLRSVVGSRLRLGVYNPLEAEGSATLKFTFRR